MFEVRSSSTHTHTHTHRTQTHANTTAAGNKSTRKSTLCTIYIKNYFHCRKKVFATHFVYLERCVSFVHTSMRLNFYFILFSFSFFFSPLIRRRTSRRVLLNDSNACWAAPVPFASGAHTRGERGRGARRLRWRLTRNWRRTRGGGALTPWRMLPP